MNHLRSDSKTSTYQGVVCGAVAGLGTRMIVAPLDLVKIRLQLQPERITVAFVARKIKNIVVNEGLKAFWKGNLPACFLYVSYSGCQFGSLRAANTVLNHVELTLSWPEPLKQVVAGALSGMVSTTVTYPFDLLRTRGAANEQKGLGLAATVKNIYKSEGLGGFFRGSSTAIIGIVPYMGSFFGTYSLLRDSETMQNLPSWFPQILSSSFLAGALSKTVVMPLDTVRKRVQVYSTAQTAYPKSFSIVALNIIKKEGFSALYRGLSIAVMKAAPSSFLSVYLFELSLSTWHKIDRLGH